MGAHGAEHVTEVQFEQAALAGLAAMQRDRADVVADPHKGRAQLRLAAVALGVEVDQRIADAEAREGAERGVEQRRPDHVAGDGDRVPGEMEGEASREPPQHHHEDREQHRRLHQADGQRGGQLGEVAGVLVEALVRVHAEDAGMGEAGKRASAAATGRAGRA